MTVVRPAPSTLPTALRDVVDYRKSGLSLNHIVGCPLDCSYCVRHLFSNFEMKRPHLVMSDLEAVDQLVGHWAFEQGVTPIQLFNRATDPFLPGVKDHLFTTLEELDRRGLANPVLVITRWRISAKDIERFERLEHVKLTILVTWSGIKDRRIEPVDSGIAEASLMNLGSYSIRTRKILYWRPIIAGLNDTELHFRRARELSHHADATVFTGLFYRDEIRKYFSEAGIKDVYHEVARRKILPWEVERRILTSFAGRPLFRKTSCGVPFAHNMADYNGHYCIQEICDICPAAQTSLCAAAHRQPRSEASIPLQQVRLMLPF